MALRTGISTHSRPPTLLRISEVEAPDAGVRPALNAKPGKPTQPPQHTTPRVRAQVTNVARMAAYVSDAISIRICAL